MGFGNARHGCKSTEEYECKDDDLLHLDLTPFLSLIAYEGDDPLHGGTGHQTSARTRNSASRESTSPTVTARRVWAAHERINVKRATAEEVNVLSLALVVVTVALTACSRETGVERLMRECGEVVASAADSETTTNPDVATVKRPDMEAVIRSEQRATTPLRKAMQAELGELETSRGYTSDKYDTAWERMVNKGGERDAIWRAAFDRDLPRRQRIRDQMIRECVWKRGTKEGAR